jgi:peptidyl-tRNA hydrolase, PTH1 family
MLNPMPSGQTDVTQIRLVAGLGNPGPEYAGTRHNIGFVVIDHLAAELGSIWEKSTRWEALTSRHGDLLLAKPMSFINQSGYPLVAIAQFYKIAPSQILVVLDDFALPLGRIRMRADGGTGGHNGLDSVIMQFGTEEIPRLRIGIGAAPAAGSVDHVLGRFFEEEVPLVKSAIERCVEAIKCAVDKGVVAAMNTFNKVEES